jgi:DNA-binding CsgD family transcriptional regulator
LIYEGPLESTPWANSLRQLNRTLDFSWTVLVLRPASRSQPSLIIQAHEQEVRVANADYIFFERYSSDPFTDLPLNRITTPEDLLGEQCWRDHPFFKEYLLPEDIYYEMGADFRAGHSQCRFRACRPLSSGPYTAEEKRVCQLLVPHFKRAVELHCRLYITEAERKLYAVSFDHLRVGTVILDERGCVMSSSETMREILKQHDSLALHNETFKARPKQADVELQDAIAQVLSDTSSTPLIRALRMKDPSQRSELRILVKGIPPSQAVEPQRRPTVAIFVRDPRDNLEPSTNVLRVLFDFTTAEARFAALLAVGMSMEEAGQQLGITRNTCKSRLQSIFGKTGVRRQAALVNVLHDALVSL